MSESRLVTIKKRLQKEIRKKLFPGCVFGLVKNNHQTIFSCGHFTYAKDSAEVKNGSVFDLASITKSVPTACLALLLIEEGKLGLDDQLIKYLPEFKNSDRKLVLIRHLLTHTLDFNRSFRLSALKNKKPAQILEAIYTTEFQTKPGQNFYYANANSVLLGLVVEKIFGQSLDKIAQKKFFKPLGMKKTAFHPLKLFSRDEIVPTEIDPWRGRVIQGEIHDESAWALRPRIIAGSAGLFSTAGDLLIFLKMILNYGTLAGKKYFKKETIQKMITNQINGLGLSTGLGWEINQPKFMGHYCGEKTFGKTGFTGCFCLGDIKKQVAFVFLCNATYPKRKPRQVYSKNINQLRADLANLVLKD
ncbi:MAG: beta-lactamase family protein [Candidatus Pacebacteria bacterium]|nr:beta-lactamase family protein [Candidatus Paceibacterota bacterium]